MYAEDTAQQDSSVRNPGRIVTPTLSSATKRSICYTPSNAQYNIEIRFDLVQCVDWKVLKFRYGYLVFRMRTADYIYSMKLQY